ncbi:MAG: DNA repair protein RadA [Bacillota bacterium]
MKGAARLKGKSLKAFVCQVCGYSSASWLGRCPNCGAWNSMQEERPQEGRSSHASAPRSIDGLSFEERPRLKTGSQELDRVLGGGIVAGSLVLLGGDPGIGKSTLLLQVCRHLAAQGQKVLYVSGEESGPQLRMRAERLAAACTGILVLTETDIDQVTGTVEELKPALCVVDSIQTVYSQNSDGIPGSVSQIRECTGQLMRLAKSTGTAVFIVGHVTKEGALAGPMVLEHLVDVVLYFEGDRSQAFRVVRAVKNRFGSTNEIGVFEMTESGLVDVLNPSQALLGDRLQGSVGSVVTACVEGSRPILVEVQALTVPSPFGTPRRAAVGLDYARSTLIAAIVEKHLGLKLATQDVFIKVTGGISLNDPGADLGVAAALFSSYSDKPIGNCTCVFGELGLGGELRPVVGTAHRLKEAARAGFKRCVIPAAGWEKAKTQLDPQCRETLIVLTARHIREAIASMGFGNHESL